MKKTPLLIATFLLACGLPAGAQSVALNIVPTPQEIVHGTGHFTLAPTTTVVPEGKGAKDVAESLIARLNAATGYDIQMAKKPSAGSIVLKIDKSGFKPEAYRLVVGQPGVEITASTDRGLFYAVQSLMQLFPPQIEAATPQAGVKTWTAPAVVINDEPRFPYRGIMLDPCRHFIPVDVMKKQIDMLSHYKINTLHWHLTDDQGWRVEIKKYPKLTEVGAWRTEGDGSRYGGFYTQDEVKDIVAYAAARHVEIIPELEIPGHELAAIAAYPWLSCRGDSITPRIIWGVEDVVMCPGKETTFDFLEDVIDELAPLFPSKYFHIGGDESPRIEWELCPNCQKLISKLGYVDEKGRPKEAQLQSYVVSRVEKYLEKKGKRIIGWDEILEGGNLNKTATIMSWRGEDGGIAAARAGHNVIMTPSSHGLYINFYQGDPNVEQTCIGGNSYLERVYKYDPVPKVLSANHADRYVLGVQGNLWAEYIHTQGQLENLLYPRALAVAEIGWTMPGRKNYTDFVRRIDTDAALRLQAHGIGFHIPLPEQPGGSCSHLAFSDTTHVTLSTTRPEKIVYTLDGSQPTAASTTYTGPIVLTQSSTIKAAVILPCGLMSPVRTIEADKQVPAPAVTFDRTPRKGLDLRLANGDFMYVADLDTVKHWYHKAAATIEAVRSQTLVPGNVRGVENYAAVAEGYVYIPEDGTYEFSTTNTQFWIDGVKLIDNDSDRIKRQSRENAQRVLAKGFHPIKVIFTGGIYGGYPTYWNDGKVNFRTPGGKWQAITADMLFRK